MKRGDLVTVAIPGDYGKPRPAVVIQNNDLTSDSTIVCLLSSDPAAGAAYRQRVEPTPANGLRQASFVMTEKVQLVRRERCGGPIGELSPEEMADLNANLTYVLGLGV